MAWTTPITFVDGSVLTAAQLNTYLRDNMLETMPAKATTQSRLMSTFVRNVIREHVIDEATISTSESTISNEWTDLTTVGPSVSVECESKALVIINSAMQTSGTPSVAAWVGFAVEGATQLDPDNTKAIMTSNSTKQRSGAGFLVTGLTSGLSNLP
jgi:hypothetical protein